MEPSSLQYLESDKPEPVPKKRRRFDSVGNASIRFYPKPNAEMSFLPLNTIAKCIEECARAKKIAIQRDFIWLVSLVLNPFEPMWLGHNCQMINDESCQKKVDYFPPINASPVTYDVVN